jgi:hypothetical protein
MSLLQRSELLALMRCLLVKISHCALKEASPVSFESSDAKQKLPPLESKFFFKFGEYAIAAAREGATWNKFWFCNYK